MVKHLFSSPKVLERLYAGPLRDYMDPFAKILIEQGYQRSTAKQKICIVADLNHWLDSQKLTVADLDEEKVEKFLSYRGQRGKIFSIEPPTLRDFLKHLREADIVPPPVANTNESDLHCLENKFLKYLFNERGLRQSTVNTYLCIVRKFLAEQFGTDAILLNKLSPSDIRGFIIHHAQIGKSKRAKLMVTALRSFLRFLYLLGEIPSTLIKSVPKVANWSLSGLPKFLSSDEVEHILDSCDKSNPAGQRDYAILLLLARLGLRAGEVAHMVLDDIDWENGKITIRGKSHREDRLPLPCDVGKALANYIRNVRPRCSTRRVFIRTKAPLQGFAGSVAICNIVERALVRAKLHPPCKGAHLLRHSLATQMLRGGASLAEIGKILRHKRLNTTQIYAKVDLTALRTIAQSWPGGEV